MLIKKEKNEINTITTTKLTTEGPLCEKDQQGLAIEHGKLLQKEALEKWTRLKKRL